MCERLQNNFKTKTKKFAAKVLKVLDRIILLQSKQKKGKIKNCMYSQQT